MTAKTVEEVVRPIYMQRHTADLEYLQDVGWSKRLLEMWTGDDEFRQALERDPDAAMRNWGLPGNPHDLRPLWDRECALSLGQEVHTSVHRYRGFIIEKLLYRDKMRMKSPRNATFKAWRQRQVNRCASELGMRVNAGIVHPTISFELTRGCSVGCWFCGIGALKLDDVWRYTPENQRLWRETLEVLADFLGPEIHGFCYWATDPLDNPDYELFCQDYHRIIGHFPQTTTAQAHKYPERVRRLLQLSAQDGHCDRFSILTKSLLKKICAEFTPEELVYVELICQNVESTLVKANAGKARQSERLTQEREKKGVPEEMVSSGTIACVSGFLFQMLDRSIKMVSPCKADERWPNGYRVYREAHFETAADVKALIDEWTNEQATPSTCPNLRPLHIRRDLKVVPGDEFRFGVENELMRLSFNGPAALGSSLPSGRFVARDFALQMEEEFLIPLPETLLVLERLYRFGVLDDEP